LGEEKDRQGFKKLRFQVIANKTNRGKGERGAQRLFHCSKSSSGRGRIGPRGDEAQIDGATYKVFEIEADGENGTVPGLRRE